ncbi:hypothetical protein SAMN04515671_4061 [Nakamurella panacisegetis]|uniref:Uncharacterized protein n=1 Tax=Nakamurella panacisegetis TaxID=1090615 RepID=A0A1H0SEH2_9ACTN|nr:hypothetical protein [Nakamurella panacisegetis]SDP40124.1 hypothetical protein SAMN04515671_4061 [Nakamurella panacisegetis]
MSSVHAATTLALWAAARAGGRSTDDVLAAVDAAGHRVGVRAATATVADRTGLPGPGSPTAGSMALLPLMTSGGVPVLLLPTAGDLRGLPPKGDITVPALDSGAVVVFPELEVGVVPTDGQWRVHSCPGHHPALSLGEANAEIDGAMAEATRSLVTLDIARGSEQVRENVRRRMLDEAVDTPPGTPTAASALLAKVISLEALLAVAAGHETAAVTSRELAVVDDALRPLTTAVRAGRRAAVAEAARVLAQQSVRSRR